MLGFKKTIFLIVTTFFLSSALYSTIINVPADQPTIQAGIDASANADTVLVQPGTYFENINFNGKNITVASLFLTTQDTSFIPQTIIDGNENGSVVRMEGLSSEAVLIGFTLTNGSGDDFMGIHIGGGLYMDNSSIECRYLIIKNNYADQAGAIACNQSDPLFSNLTIINNNAEISSIAFGFLSTPTFVNCTIADNTADDYCGGIICTLGSEIMILNSILWNNDDFQIGFYEEFTPCEATISYSDIEGGEAGIVTNNNGTVNWMDGNMDVDPLFVDEGNGDYNLQSTSPCIDAGDPVSSLDPDGTIADMGAWFYNQGSAIEDNEIENVNCNLSNYPNPFNPLTTIKFDIKENENGILIIFNMKGQIVESHQFEAGEHNFQWNASSMSSGIYLYQLQTENITVNKKMLLLK